MLLDFLQEHRDELIERARRRVAGRSVPRAYPTELEKGVPLFLTHLTEVFRQESPDARKGPGALEAAAGVHGVELLKNGLSVAQAIHDYGDICQVVTELATELKGGLSGTPADLFKPFEQRGSDRTGLGLGLGIARKAAAACGGSIRIDNLPGKGCIFTIDLPVATRM